MTLKSKTFLVLLLMSFVSVNLMAFDGYLPGHKLYSAQQEIFSSISDYWQVQENYVNYVKDPTPANEKIWNDSIKSHSDNSIMIGKKVVDSIKKNHHDEVELLSDIYKSLPVPARASLYLTLGYLKFEVQHANKIFMTDEKFREYFPGYGYTEPGYKYRKGREVEREYKGVTWQSEEHSISTTWDVNITISIDLLNIITGMLSSGAIKDLEVGPRYEMNVNGQPMIVCNVTFRRVKSIVTKTNRKFEINKVWFELLRAKSSFWSDEDWHLVGKTYEILQEPTGEAVVTGIEG